MTSSNNFNLDSTHNTALKLPSLKSQMTSSSPQTPAYSPSLSSLISPPPLTPSTTPSYSPACKPSSTSPKMSSPGYIPISLTENNSSSSTTATPQLPLCPKASPRVRCLVLSSSSSASSALVKSSVVMVSVFTATLTISSYTSPLNPSPIQPTPPCQTVSPKLNPGCKQTFLNSTVTNQT